MKRKPLRKVSAKRAEQLKQEKLLTARLIIKQKGRCADCNKMLSWGSAKHEIKFRSQGGDPTDEENTILLCLKCHGKRHGLNLIVGGLHDTKT